MTLRDPFFCKQLLNAAVTCALTSHPPQGRLQVTNLLDDQIAGIFKNNTYGYFWGSGGLLPVITEESVPPADCNRLRENYLRVVKDYEDPCDGILHGIAGEYLLGWTLNSLGRLDHEHLSILEKRIEILAARADQDETDEFDVDLFTGTAGNLLAVIRALDFVRGTVKRKLDSIGRRLFERVSRASRNLITETCLVGGDVSVERQCISSFAHGVIGAILVLHQGSKQIHGTPDVEWFTDYIPHIHSALRSNPQSPWFCSHSHAIEALVNHLNEDDDSWPTPRLLPSTTSPSLCCGFGAYHVARLTPIDVLGPFMQLDQAGIDNIIDSCSLGYMGASGILYILQAKKIPSFDPIWGRRIL